MIPHYSLLSKRYLSKLEERFGLAAAQEKDAHKKRSQLT